MVGEEEGIYELDKIIVKYVMERIKGKITVNFIDKAGNQLADSIITEGYLEESYELTAPDIEGYNIIKSKQIKTTYTEKEQVIDVIYEKIEEPEMPATGDINVAMYMIILASSIIGIYIKTLKKVK